MIVCFGIVSLFRISSSVVLFFPLLHGLSFGFISVLQTVVLHSCFCLRLGTHALFTETDGDWPSQNVAGLDLVSKRMN